MVEDKGKVDSTVLLSNLDRIILDELQKQQFTWLKGRIPRAQAKGEHRFLDALINLGEADI
jgi:hypothetical protein